MVYPLISIIQYFVTTRRVRLAAVGVVFHRANFWITDTVERNILDLAARKGLSLYTKGNSAGNLPNFALASTTRGKGGQKGDFISRYGTNTTRMGWMLIIVLDSAEDMLAILFPHLFEDLEFLVPPQHDMVMDDAVVTDVSEGISHMHVNAEAGPSRLE